MAVRKIQTEISLLGEKEFNDQMKAVNSNLKTLKSEMALTSSEFKGQANSAEALRAKQKVLSEQYEQQAEKVKALEKMLEKAKSAYGENSSQVDRYRQQLNNAKTTLNRFGDELDDTNKYLKEAEDSADGAATSIDKFGKEVKDAGDDIDRGGGFGDLIGQLGDLKGLLTGGAVVGGMTALYGAISDVVEETKEYRQIMGTLEVSSQQAGYTTEQTTAAYKRLYGVLGDTQKAATTVANLQAIGLEQGELMTLLDAVTGAWATYGDSIPIDGLSEAVNETIQTGKVTGVFADVLNWAGVSEDEFNEKLAAANDTSGRAQLVLDQLSSQNLPELAQAWRDANRDIIDYNETQEELNGALADLGETLQPLVTRFTQFKTSMIQQLQPVAEWIVKVIDKITELGNKKISVDTGTHTPSSDYQALLDTYKVVTPKGVTGTRTSGGTTRQSYAGGLSYVPFDGYLAELHRGERVLTAGQAAVSESGTEGARVVELHTTIELDRNKVGEAVTKYQIGRERAGRA